ncbi:carbohydrate ABC transporter permease [Salibacterium halotolerans]|uniref:Multiple sugar transport system permease protein n=1 Tax=Salibacterium halotolerans TaxID=1884432 RepID=A0A1I5S8M5_9BACI|nr:carbohydrate ABC transporter permease [Salibacterium halotolerans]SFP67092.1 multiple sugar transport system permease protein [Salibacterium halotolerans]
MKKNFHKNKKKIGYIIIILSSLIMFTPFITATLNSLKTYAQYTAVPVEWIPDPFRWENYADVWQMTDFALYGWNSLIVTVMSVLGAILSCSMVAYAFARLEFPFKNMLFFMVLGTLMIPPVVMIIPQFIIFRYLGFLDTLVPLWILEWLAQPFGVFLMRQAFLGIPKAYEEAATLDGCTPFQTYWRVFLPMCKPQLATLTIFTFMTKWNEIMAPVIYLSSSEKYTLPIGVLQMSGAWFGKEQYLVAAAIMSLIPVLIVFLLTEKFFIKGASSSGLK